MGRSVEKVYGTALFSAAQESNRLRQVMEEAKFLEKTLSGEREFRLFMENPDKPLSEKQSLLTALFPEGISAEIPGLLSVVCEKKRTEAFPGILKEYIRLAKRELRIGDVYVETPFEISGETKKKIEETVLRTSGFSELEMHYGINAGLLGGIVIRIGDRVVDSSVSSKLDSLKRELLKTQIK